MIPSTPSNHQEEDGEQPNPDCSKITSDPKSDGKHKRKKDKTRNKTQVENGDTEEADLLVGSFNDAIFFRRIGCREFVCRSEKVSYSFQEIIGECWAIVGSNSIGGSP